MADPEPQKQEPQKDGKDALENTPAEPAPRPAPSPAPASSSFPPTRPLYVPQFTAATQMILKRMKGEPSSLSAALSQASRSPSMTASIPSATYEDVKRRLVMGMNTSTQMTMQMPAAPPVRPLPSLLPAPAPTVSRPAASTAGMSAIRKVTAGLTASSKPTPIKPAPSKPALASEPKTKKPKPPTTSNTPNKRKRPRTQPTASDDSDPDTTTSTPSTPPSPSSAPPPTTEQTTNPPTPTLPTTTKSGRQVLKPTAYNPAAMDAASKRARGPLHHYGKRTTEQALCRRCSRMHSPAANQIVFCDGCDGGWHQLCHEPRVGDEVVRDLRRGWFCRGCAAKRGGVKKQKVGGQQQLLQQGEGVVKKEKAAAGGERERESWAGRPAQQKRAYLSTLAQQELVALLMACLETHPDLPVFPPTGAGAGGGSEQPAAGTTAPRSLFAGTTTEGLFARAEAHPTGQINFVRKVGRGGKARAGSGKGGSQKEDSLERMEGAGGEEDEFDPLAALWPRAGMGLYARLPPDTEDEVRLVDEGDYEAFSVILYEERGRKVEENGMRV